MRAAVTVGVAGYAHGTARALLLPVTFSEGNVSNRYAFVGGERGPWRVVRLGAFRGAVLAAVERLDVVNGAAPVVPPETAWVLQGFTSNLRYATRIELETLQARQPALDRPEATCAALIPIKKSAAWWALAQDERRAIFEEQARHTQIGLDYLPAVARRLHHCRDLDEPFDFLTWFQYAPEHAAAFEQLVARLRASKEWE